MSQPEGPWRAALLDALGEGLFVLKAGGTVIELNTAFATILGYGPEGLPYSAPFPWWPDPADADHPQVIEAMAQLQSGTGVGRWVLPLRHRDGHRVWVEVSTGAMPGSQGRDVVGVVRDVTAERRLSARDRLLAEAGRALTESSGLEARLAEAARVLAEMSGELIVIARAEPDGRMRIVTAADPKRPGDAALLAQLGAFRVPPSLSGQYAERRAFIVRPIPDQLLREMYDDQQLTWWRTVQPHSALIAPLIASGRVLGVLLALTTNPGRRFDRINVELAEEMGRRISGVIDIDRAADREHQLHQASTALAAATTVAEAATALASAFQRALGASGVVVFTREPDDPHHLRLRHNLGYGPEFTGAFHTVALTAPLITTEVVRTGHPVWVGNQAAMVEKYPHLGRLEVVRDGSAMASLPLRLGDQILGAVTCTFPTTRIFPTAEREFTLTLVGQAAQAIERASMTDTHWRIAQSLQHSLLPRRLPELLGLALAGHYQPAGRHAQAGGDWYDVILLGPRRVAVVVGDVVGHGAAAAAIMGQLRGAMSALLLQGRTSAEALHDLSRTTERIPGALASTAVVVILDVTTGELRWSCAGHPPPLLIDPNDSGSPARFLTGASGPCLGAHPLPAPSDHGARPGYPEGRLTLPPGAGVLLYTDGLVERRGEVIDLGLDRLAAALGTPAGASAAELLGKALDTLSDTTAHDDIALVVAQRASEPMVS